MFFLNADFVSSALSCAHGFWTSHFVTASCVSTVLGMISQVLSLLLWKMFFGLPFVEYWPRVSDYGNRSFGTRRLRCNLVTRMSTIRLPWMLGSERCPGFLLPNVVHPDPQKKNSDSTREKLLNHPEPNFLRFKSHNGNSADGIESLAEDGLKLSFAKPLVKQGLFGGRVRKDTIKRHVDPDDYCS